MNEIKKLELRIAKLPKGSITKKVIQGKERYYLQWREADKVKSRYLSSAELPVLSAQIAQRKELQQKLVELQVASIEQTLDGVTFPNATAGIAAEPVASYRSLRIDTPDCMHFTDLVSAVNKVSEMALQGACSAVNRMQTVRNWLIGKYIVEYEQDGKDRAKYGTGLLKSLEAKVNARGMNVTLFQLSRRFYQLYPEMESLIYATPSHKSITGSSCKKHMTSPERLLSNLSFSHIRECMLVDDELARYFYETECIKGGWSVKELRRQISSCLYERCGLSKDPSKLLKISHANEVQDICVRDPFTFEFLGIPAADVVCESDLEAGLIEHLQEFILELGKGFCFEARQKRLIIDDRYYFADLVFYNRLLHCNVIVELKTDEFKHEYLGQLNSYVSYFRENEMAPGDNPPVGILLCTRKGPKMVEYAKAGLDNELFVSSYKLKLPTKAELKVFLEKNLT